MVKSMILMCRKEQIRKGKGFRGNFGESFDYEKFYCKCSIFLFIIYFYKKGLYYYLQQV